MSTKFNRYLALASITIAGICQNTTTSFASEKDLQCQADNPVAQKPLHAQEGTSLGGIIDISLDENDDFLFEGTPVLHFDYVSGKKVISLDQASRSSVRASQLETSRANQGYRVVHKYNIELGAGFRAEAEHKDFTTGLTEDLWHSVGLIPVFGRSVTTTRYARDKQEVERIQSISSLPSSTDYLNSLKPNDTVAYSSRGGIVFSVGTGVGPVGVGLNAMAMGEFFVYMQKLTGNRVYIRIDDIDIKTFGVQKGAYIVNRHASQFQKYAKGFGFIVNLSSNEGQQAFRSLMAGNLAEAQSLAARGGSTQAWVEATSTQWGVDSGFFLGLPILLKYGWNKTNFEEFAQTRYLKCNRQIKAKYKVYQDFDYNVVFGFSEEARSSFYAANFQTQTLAGATLEKGLFGQFVWNYSSIDTTAKSLRQALQKLAKNTGLKEVENLTAPGKEELANVDAEVRIHMGQKNINTLMSRASRKQKRKILLGARSLVWQYFANGDRAGICTKKHSSTMVKTALTEGDSLANCKSKYRAQTELAAKAMLNALAKMRTNHANGEYDAQASALRDFGKHMLTNRFTFQLGLKLAGKGTKLDIVLEGTDIARFEKTLASVGSTAKFVRENRQPIVRNRAGTGKAVTVRVFR